MASQNNQTDITITPIGCVKNDFKQPASAEAIRAQESRLLIEPAFVPGLDGLTAGQHIWVLFIFHQSQGYDLHQHPRGDRNRPQRGVFTLRSPHRPNRIGMTQVELLQIDGNVLHVGNLDAIDGSPIVDIKPA